MMQRFTTCCLVCFIINAASFAQQTDTNLHKGRELLLLEEYPAAQYYLRLASVSKFKSLREDAELSLAELFLLTQQPDSATAIMIHLKESSRFKQEVQFLSALKNFLDGRFDESLPELLSLQIRIPEQNSLLKGKAYYYTGVINFRKRNKESISQSIKDLQLAITYFKKDSTQTYLKLSLARMQLADVFRFNRQPTQALMQLRLATKILEGSPFPKPAHLANAYGIEGRILYSTNNFVRAKVMFEKSLHRQLSANADSASIGLTYSNLASCNEELFDYNACEKANIQTAAFWSTLKNQPDRLINFSNNYALFLREIHEPVSAVDRIQKVLPLLESERLQSKQPIFQTFFNLALLHYDLDDFASCKKYLDQLEHFIKEYPNAVSDADQIKTNSLKAMWLRKEKKLDQAIELCKSINSHIDSTNIGGLKRAEFYSTYGDILNSADLHQQSLIQLHKARAIYDEQGGIHQIEISNELAMSFFGQMAFDSVIAYCSRSLQYNTIKKNEGLIYPYYLPQDAIQSCYLTIISRLRQYQNSLQFQLLDEAVSFEELGIDLIRGIRKNLYSDADRVSYNKEVNKFYDACCLLYFYRWQNKSNGAANKFFEYAEESKFQALANGITASRVNSFKEVNTALLKEEKDLAREKILENQQLVQLLALAPDEDEIEHRKTETRTQLQAIEKKHDHFLDSLRRNFSGYYFLKYGGKSLSMVELQTEVRQDQCILQLKVIDSLIVIQAITPGFVSLFLLPQADVLRKKVNKLRNLIQFKLQTEFVQLSNEIFQTLISPVESEYKKNKIKIKSIIIVPDDFFYLLPFEALAEQVKPLRYFIQSHEVSYAYSCNLMVQSKRDIAFGVGNNFLGIAPLFRSEEIVATGTRSTSATTFTAHMSYDDYGFKPLKENENEINLIANLVNNKLLTRTLLSGADADESHLKSLDLSKFKYIHFATHGFVNTYNSGLSGLALTNASKTGEDNILYTSEIYNLNLKADLVCLSACETGLGQNAPGEGLIGLGRAFFYSGAHNLLVSLWKVPDESTSQFMIDFYQKFFNPDGHFSTSLRQAKLKMIKTPSYQNPYYWAPFILIGSN